MAKVSQRSWKTPDRRIKRKAWGFTVQVNGKQKKHYHAEWTKEDAEKALAEIQLGIAQPKILSGMNFGAAVERYLASKSRKRTVADDERILGVFKACFGPDTPLAEITASRISAWKGERLATTSRQTGAPLSLASVNRPLSVLRGVLRTARFEWEALERVPMIKMEREPQGRLRWLTPEEAERLLTACHGSRNADLADLAEFCLFTGLRQGEALGLMWADVDRARGVVLLEVTKSGRRREVPLNQRADAVLARRARRDGRVFGARTFHHFRSAWEMAVRKARLADFRFHDLRHTFASWAVQRRVTLPELKDLLGHSSLQMVQRYAHLGPEHLRTAVSSLDDVFPLAQGIAQEVLEAEGITQK